MAHAIFFSFSFFIHPYVNVVYANLSKITHNTNCVDILTKEIIKNWELFKQIKTL